MDWEFALHVVYREALHITAGIACAQMLRPVWFECRRAGWLPKLTGLLYAAPPCLLVLALVAVREPFDAQHDPAWKSVIDYAGWAFGFAIDTWLQLRYRQRNTEWTANAARQLGRWAPVLGIPAWPIKKGLVDR